MKKPLQVSHLILSLAMTASGNSKDMGTAEILLFYLSCKNLKISYPIAGGTPMPNKLIRYLAFLLFTWIVYNSYMFIIIPLNFDGWTIIYEFVTTFCHRSLINLYELVLIYICDLLYWDTKLTLIWLLIWLVPWILWWKKQTLRRAWLLAFFGSTWGPGGEWTGITNAWVPLSNYIIGFLVVNLFFFYLVVINMIRRECFPHNRFFNTIISWLQRICLRT